MDAGVFSLYLLFVILPALFVGLWLYERHIRRIVRDELRRRDDKN